MSGTAGWRKNTFLRCHNSHLQLEAAITIAAAAGTEEGKAEQKKATCSPDEHFTLGFLLQPPSARGQVSLQTRILDGTLSRASFQLSQHKRSGLKYAFQTYFIYI